MNSLGANSGWREAGTQKNSPLLGTIVSSSPMVGETSSPLADEPGRLRAAMPGKDAYAFVGECLDAALLEGEVEVPWVGKSGSKASEPGPD